MRKVIYAIHLTIDGCCDHTSFRPDEEVFEYFNDLMQGCDLIAYGRKFYEILFPYWAEEENRESKRELNLPKKSPIWTKLFFPGR
jgi:hypothetical protein